MNINIIREQSLCSLLFFQFYTPNINAHLHSEDQPKNEGSFKKASFGRLASVKSCVNDTQISLNIPHEYARKSHIRQAVHGRKNNENEQFLYPIKSLTRNIVNVVLQTAVKCIRVTKCI